MDFASDDGSFAITLERATTAPRWKRPGSWHIRVRFDGVAFGDGGPDLVSPDLEGLGLLWTATDERLDPDASAPEDVLATILGDDVLHDAALPNLGEAFDRRGPVRRYRWRDEVVWLHRDPPGDDADARVRIARVPVDGYLEVVRRAAEHHATVEG